MRTGLTKKQKTTVIYFDEHSRLIEVQTHNTDLKKRLTAFAAKYPQCCRQTDDDEQGGLIFDTAQNAGEPPAKRRKSAAFIEKLHICMETVIEKFVFCMI